MSRDELLAKLKQWLDRVNGMYWDFARLEFRDDLRVWLPEVIAHLEPGGEPDAPWTCDRCNYMNGGFICTQCGHMPFKGKQVTGCHHEPEADRDRPPGESATISTGRAG